ncbi:MAG: 2'-5' RNA ligase family protein [Terracoccus sp.]
MLQVPVPRLEPFVRARTLHYDTDWLSPDPTHVHAHVTALGPFVAPDLLDDATFDKVAEIVSSTAAFDFTVERMDTFPNGIIHLLPDPEGPFRRLTDDLVSAFPQCPPYAGQFADVRPHLTLDAVSSEVSAASTARLLADLVLDAGARCRAERLDLVHYAPGALRVLRSWRLGDRPGGEVSAVG